MDCPLTDCVKHNDCGILEITKKIPKDKNSCSYFKDQAQQNKEQKKLDRQNEIAKTQKKRKPK